MPRTLSLSLWAAVVFSAVAVCAGAVTTRLRPVGISEEHFYIGQTLRQTGTLSMQGAPSLLRPPAYPAFVAAVLWASDHAARVLGEADPALERGRCDGFPCRAPGTSWADMSTVRLLSDEAAVERAQVVLLGLFAAFIFLTAAQWCSVAGAAIIGLSSGLNPYSISISTALSYHLLLLTAIAAATLGVVVLVRGGVRARGPWIAAGALWGAAAFVKPVALVFPAFLAPLLLALYGRRHAARLFACFVGGMVLVTAPYVARNYLVSGRAIFTAQGGMGFWGSTVERIPDGRRFLDWGKVWVAEGRPIFARVTGVPAYTAETLEMHRLMQLHAAQLDTAFWEEAARNFTRSPGIYLHNVGKNFVSFVTDGMLTFPTWYFGQNGIAAWVGTVDAGMTGYSFLALVGVLLGLLMDRAAWVLLAVYAALVVSHTISFSYEFYTYVKLPVIYLGPALLLGAIEAMVRQRCRRCRRDRVVDARSDVLNERLRAALVRARSAA